MTAVGVAILIPGPFLLWVLANNGVNIPFEDEWNWGPLIAKMHDGTLTFNDVWVPHNEHRIFFPTLIALGLAKIFGWNVVFESVVGITLFTLAQFPLFRLTRDTLGRNWGALAFVVTSAVLFSLGQVENIMTGFQIAWFLIVFCALSTIDVLRSKTVGAYSTVLGAALCLIASFSSALGLCVPMIAVFLIVTRRPIRPIYTAAWVAYALLLALIYMHDLHNDLSQSHLAGTLADRLLYVLVYLGSPVAGALGPTGSAWIGAGGLGWAFVCAIVFARDARDPDRRPQWTPWFALSVFGIVCAAMTAYGRTVLGVGEALVTRYTTLGAQFWIALVPLTVLVLETISRRASQRIRRRLAVITLAAFCLLGYRIGVQSVAGYEAAIGTVAARAPALRALQGDPEKVSDRILLTVYPDAAYVRSTVEALRKDDYWPPRQRYDAGSSILERRVVVASLDEGGPMFVNSQLKMPKASNIFETFATFVIVAVALAIVYLAFTLVPVAVIPVQSVAPQPTVGQLHIGRIGGRTDLFTIDRISVDGKVVAPGSGGHRTTFAVRKGSDIIVSGWALDSAAHRAASHVVALVGKDLTIGPTAVARPDVVQAFQLGQESLNSGFNLSVPTADLDRGAHRAHFLAIGADGASLLDTKASFDFIER